MPEMIATIHRGFYKKEFADLDPAIRKRLLRLMARISESSYRRGFQQGVSAVTTGRRVKIRDLAHWRLVTPLDKSVAPHDERTTTSFERLAFKHTCELAELGFEEIYFGIDEKVI
jgi:hypothetical protein